MIAKGKSFSGIFKARGGLFEPPQFILLGAPYDGSSSFRPGARLAPAQIREMAESLNACTERGLDLSGLPATDDGDLALGTDRKAAPAQIESATSRVLEEGAVPLLLGGDHFVTVPAFRAALRKYPGLKLLYLDAHPDLYPDYEGDPLSHACVVSRILELEGMSGERITQVGIRAPTSQQLQAAQEAGIRVVPAWELPQFHYEEEGPVYLSLDIDVLDPAYAPGCGNPVPGGPSTRELLTLLQGIKCEIVALDVAEVNPLVDPSGITALAAARIVIELVGVLSYLTKPPL
jgi:agmatinase